MGKSQVKKKRRGRPAGPWREQPTEAKALQVLDQIRARGLTITEAAALIGIGATSLSRWLREGVTTLYAIETLTRAGFLK